MELRQDQVMDRFPLEHGRVTLRSSLGFKEQGGSAYPSLYMDDETALVGVSDDTYDPLIQHYEL